MQTLTGTTIRPQAPHVKKVGSRYQCGLCNKQWDSFSQYVAKCAPDVSLDK